MSTSCRILLIEDSPHDADLVVDALTEAGLNIAWERVDSADAMRRRLEEKDWDVVLCDYSLPGFDAPSALRLLRASRHDVPFIIVSGTVGEETAVEAMRAGADDYVMKDRLARLAPVVLREMREAAVRRERRTLERRLREEEARFRALVENSGEAVIVLDAQARLIYGSPSTQRILRYAPEALAQRSLFDFVVPEDIGHVRAELANVAQTWGATTKIEFRCVCGDGVTHWFEAAATNLLNVPSVGGVVLNARDISVRKNAEAELRREQEKFLRAQRLESIGMLAAGIAHDLNNVLAPIIMAVPMLRANATTATDQRMLDTLEKCADRGTGLVRQILGFTHGIGGEPRIIHLKHIVRDVIGVIVETFPKSIVLDWTVSADLWPIRANPTQIHQVLLNLCVNARDAMPGGGTLRLEVSNRTLNEATAATVPNAKPGTWVMLRIEDTGTGIDADVLPHIWDPFYTTKAAGQGTGLGLSTVRGIVETHHGFITLDTAKARGTTFSIYLPAAEVPAATEPATGKMAPLRGNGELILLVDDEKLIRDTADAILRKAGYRVVCAADGAEALTIFPQHSAECALVVTDLDMPNLGGEGLIRGLREIKPTIAVMAMSGLNSRQIRSQTNEAVCDFLPKPFTAETLLESVSRLVRSADARHAEASASVER